MEKVIEGIDYVSIEVKPLQQPLHYSFQNIKNPKHKIDILSFERSTIEQYHRPQHETIAVFHQ